MNEETGIGVKYWYAQILFAKFFHVSIDINNNIFDKIMLLYVYENPNKIKVIPPWILVFFIDIFKIGPLY